MNTGLDVINVIQESTYKALKGAIENDTAELAKEKILQATQSIRDKVDITINCHVRACEPAREICDYTEANGTELLIIEASGHSAITMAVSWH